ncbi:MAG TPA: PKD domain-containing protein, partial [Candidatus Nanoarchaeia archaeon]|nr:PKD domain-containing protein [Candidatus Nanoarchaeia archaeon]
NVTVKKGNDVAYRRTFTPVFAGAPIVETRVLDNTSNAGNYTVYAVMRYLNISEYKNATFEMVAPFVSPISVTISANATTINENDPVHFAASVSGTTGSVSYMWDFQNDGNIDSTTADPTYIYGSNGTFTVNLTVKDSISNQTDTEIITSRKIYNVTVNVKNNLTSGAIQNAQVEFGDEKINTSSDGKAQFTVIKDRHELIVKKPGYATFSNKTDVNGNSVLDVYLTEADIIAPSLELVSPGNNERVSNDYAVLKFKTSDNNGMNCRLYMSTDASFWSEINRSDVQSGAESYFKINSLQNGTYFWKISCIDRSGNTNTSPAYSFVVDTSLAVEDLVSIEETNEATLEFSGQVNAIIAGIDGMDEDGRQAAEAMQLKKTLEKSKTGIGRANRDLESLKWRRLNETELQKETQSILDRIQLIKDTTPRSISVLEKNEFIKYPSKNDIGLIAKKLANSTNYKFTKKETDALIDETYKLQSLMTVTTKVKIVEVEYMSGEKATITVVQKNIDAKNGIESANFYEVFPKEIAKNLSEVELLFEYEIIDPDPIIKIDAEKNKDFSYYIKKKIDIIDAEKLQSILVGKEIKPKASGNLLTGLVSFDSAIIDTIDVRLVAEFSIIFVLLLVFLYYQFGYEKIGAMLHKEDPKLKEISILLDGIALSLSQNNYQEAKEAYKKVNDGFKALSKENRPKIYPRIMEMHAKIDFVYMDNLLNEADVCLKNGLREKSVSIYGIVSGLYKGLPQNYKAKIAARCIELHKKLNPQ